jgi:hypothetical protein
MGRRNIGLMVRVTPAERDSLKKRAGAMRMAVYMRQCSLHRAPCSVPEINRSTAIELGRIGNNLNQLARAANACNTLDLSATLREINALRLTLIEAQR